ncbi:fibrous sheath-interacting protein 1 isoform X2 [Boleophthalmus pectinirostris]|uniref:fibrous sheath-interacting protein 1 isoform X2 n=1 Tax=Boleophthalmus pectinirostris TaxID=150288 RepID=UPI0024319FA9|nr:fibrous sheath-interacting protein 1 isoform X2 [Boleophthalmus pectinirostris]
MRHMEIFRGQLDNISRPASSGLTGSRVSSVSPQTERITSPSALSLVVLTQNVQSGVDLVTSGDNDLCATTKHEDEEEDLKLQKAIEEMRRLDEILSFKTVQGQEAKRQRKEIRDKLWQELLQNTPKGRSECAHEASNTRSFLALDALTAKVHKEEVNYEPVFETEAPDCDDDRKHVYSMSNRSADSVESLPETDFMDIEQEHSQGSHCEGSKIKKKHKDFVKRNIELISAEGGQEVLTQLEKERLDELLREIDQEEEDCARGADAEDDVWAVSVSTGQGYTPEPPDLKQLHDIDSRIRLLLPVEEFASLQTSYSNLSEVQGSEAGWRTEGDPLPGEKALKDERERRGQERRLQEIQQQLHRLSHSQDDEGPDLTEEQLQSLLEECELAETWTRDMDVNDFSPR